MLYIMENLLIHITLLFFLCLNLLQQSNKIIEALLRGLEEIDEDNIQ